MKGFELAFLAVGAIIGAFVRYRMTESSIVFGGLSVNVLLVNVIGSFILGAFSVVSPHLNLDPNYTLLMSIGFCGSLTSMSSFALETCNLLDGSYLYHAVVNILANVFLSLGALISARELTTVIIGLLH